jgi:homoserine kinase
MTRVTVTVPAVCLNLGPGIDSLGLALALRNTVEMSLHPNLEVSISVRGGGQSAYPVTTDHPALQAAQALWGERGPGVFVTCTGEIPPGVGLGDDVAWMVGGLVAANNLVESAHLLNRERLIERASRLTGKPAAVVAAMLGGLTVTSSAVTSGDQLLYQRVDIPALRVVLVVPEIADYGDKVPPTRPDKIDLADALFNIGRTALVIDALRRGDMDALCRAMQDRILEPQRKGLIPGYDQVIASAKTAGAAAAAICGDGPAVVAFASTNHAAIESAMRDAFRQAGIQARTWTLHVDTQGIAINFRQ